MVLWGQYHPEMKKSILVRGKDLTQRQVNRHLKAFLLSYAVHVLERNSIKVSLPPFSYV